MVKKQVIVSIIISTFNDEKYIQKTILSVLSQTFEDWELIIFDDKSTDRTPRIIESFRKKDKRIILIRNKNNYGQTVNVNRGIRLSKGKYIARLDGDDQWSNKDKLQKQVDFLESRQSYGLVGTYGYAVDQEGNKLYEICHPVNDKHIRKYSLRHGCFIHSSVVIRKDKLLEAGLYDEQFRISQDYDLYLKMGTVSKLYNIPQFSVNYTINPEGVSRKKYKQQVEIAQFIVKKYKEYYPNFLISYVMWKLRRYYPYWFRGYLSNKLKKIIMDTIFGKQKHVVFYFKR